MWASSIIQRNWKTSNIQIYYYPAAGSLFGFAALLKVSCQLLRYLDLVPKSWAPNLPNECLVDLYNQPLQN